MRKRPTQALGLITVPAIAVTLSAATFVLSASPAMASTPTISGFTPAAGLVGSSVTITGTSLTGATAVNFNGTSATFTANSAGTSVTATVPNGATNGPISVTTPGGTATSTTNFTVNELPPGFAKAQLAHGLKNPTAFAFAPNGDIYVAEQQGPILIYRNGQMLPTPVVTLNTDGAAEKGVLGIALDPNFATNGYMYVSYTTLDERAQVSRLTVQNGSASLSIRTGLPEG